jgi:hypothetical protein
MKLHAPMRRTTVVTITAAASLVEGGMAGLILQDKQFFSPAGDCVMWIDEDPYRI